ncbi:hypothetical protein OG937_45880 [Streptomyces sp. NBC_00510]
MTEARRQVTAAYQGMIDAQAKAFATGTLEGSRIEKYAWDKALSGTKGTILFNRQNGIVYTGRPKFQVKSSSVDLGITPHRATLTVCFDNANWTPVDKKTRRSVSAPNQRRRYISTAALRTVGDRWLVIDGNAERDRAC